MTPNQKSDEETADVDDIRALVGPLNPAPGNNPTAMERDRFAVVWEDLTEVVASSGAGNEPPRTGPVAAPRRKRRSRGGRRVGTRYAVGGAAVAAVASVAALAAVAAVSLPQSASAAPVLPVPLVTTTSGDHQSAATFLQRMAAQQQAEPGAGNPVTHTKVQEYGLDTTVAGHKTSNVARTVVREVWWGPQKATRVTTFVQNINRAGGDVGGPRPESASELASGFPTNAYVNVGAGLPADPNRLAARFRSEAGASAQGQPDRIVLGQAALTLLADTNSNPAQDAAAYRLLARLPDLFDAGRVTDRLGRDAQVVGLVTSGAGSSVTAVTYLAVDPATGSPLDVETVDTPGAPAGLHLPPGPTVDGFTQIIARDRIK